MNARKSRPTGELPDALREWCEREYLRAELAQRTHKSVAAPPGLRWPEDNIDDWVEFISSPCARRLMRAAMKVGIFEVVTE